MPSRSSWQERIPASGERRSETIGQVFGLILGVGFAGLLFALATSLTPPLAFDRPLKSRVAGRPLDVIPLDLESGQALTARVEQRGVDVALRLLDPRGREVAAADSPFGKWGTEALYAVISRSGRYRLELRLASPRNAGAHYVLTLERPRRATARDVRRSRALKLLRRGEEAQRRDDLAQAHRTFLEAAALLDPLARESRAWAFFQAGQAAEKDHDLSAARAHYAAVAERGSPAERALSWYLLGQIEEGQAGRESAARDAFERCQQAALEDGDRFLAAKAWNEIGVLLQKMGKLERAIDAIDRAQDLWPLDEEPENLAIALHNLGKLLHSLGQSRLARVHFLRALDLARTLGDPDVAVREIDYLIQTSSSLESGRAWFEKALRYRPSPRRQAELHLRWGGRLLEAGRPAEARPEIERALALAQRERGLEELRWNARANLARILDLEGREAESLAAFAEAMRYYVKHQDAYGIYSILRGRALALKDLGRIPEARRAIERALELAESVRLEERGQTALERYSVRIEDFYDLAIELALEAGQADRAFELAEQARARTLLAQLSDQRLEAPAELAARRDELKQQIADINFREEVAWLDDPVLTAPLGSDSRFDRLLADLFAVQAAIEIQAEPPGRSLVAERPLTLAEIQRALGADTALLAYSLGKEQSVGWVVTSASLAGFALGPRARIEEDVSAAIRQLRLPPGEPGRDAGEMHRRLAGLSRTLLTPFAGRIRGKRLVLLVEGALAYLPFAALPDPDDAMGGATLGSHHDLVRAPSASVAILLNQMAGRRPWPPRTLAVLGDAVYDFGDERLFSLPPPAETSAPQSTGIRGTGLLDLHRLRHTGAEAEGIARLFPTPFRALAFEANRDTVTSGRLRFYDAIHFALHGFTQPNRPELSGIVLSVVDRQGRRQDGVLRSFDIRDLDLPASLVVLSGCETGLGDELEGEGIGGLVRGFFQAGTPRVVASLWSVDDEATSDLMIHFYEGIKQRGLSAPAALRAAQEEVKNDLRWRDPYYWAGFVLEGAWR